MIYGEWCDEAVNVRVGFVLAFASDLASKKKKRTIPVYRRVEEAYSSSHLDLI